MLDAALALAEDLTSRVRGQIDQKTSCLKLLESTSNLIDARECDDNFTDPIAVEESTSDLHEEPGLLLALPLRLPRQQTRRTPTAAHLLPSTALLLL